MQISKNFILKKTGEGYMIVPLSDGAMDFTKIYHTNEIGAIIFEELQKGTSVSKIVHHLEKEFDASKDVIENDVNKFIEQLRKRNILYD